MFKFNKEIDRKLFIAVFLMIISNLGWMVPLFIVPWLSISIETRVIVISSFVIMGHITYNLGLFIAGSRVIKRLKQTKNFHLVSIFSQLRLFWFMFTAKFKSWFINQRN